MFRFEHIDYLWALALLPLFLLFFILMMRMRRARMQQYADPELMAILAPEVSNGRAVVKFLLIVLAFACMIIALAGPMIGSRLQEVKRKGVEIMALLDVSNSMMAQDIQPSRLERSRQALSKMTERLVDDKLGLIVFAGEAYIQLPITTDYVSARMFLSSLRPDWVPVQGTAIGAAIRLATRSFSPETEAGKAIIILTDGENHEDDAVAAATAASEAGITVHVIGVGLPEGAPVPLSGQANNSGSQEFMRDREGNVVISKLNEQLLRQIATAGKGIFVRSNQAQVGLNTLFSEIENMEKGTFQSIVYADYEPVYRWPAGIALLLLLIELLISSRKRAGSKLSLWGKFWPATLILLLFSPSIDAQNVKQQLREGNRLYEKGKFAEAEVSYRKGLEQESLSFEGAYNLGNALYKQERFQEAQDHFETLAEGEQDAAKRARLNFNLGNSLFKNNKLQESADAFRKALRDAPGDKDAQHNLSEVLRQLKAQQEQQKQDQKQDQQQNQDQQQQQQDQNQDQQNKQDQQDQDRKQNQDQNNQDNKDKQEEKQQGGQQSPQQISPEDARRLLEALRQDEKETLDKLQKQNRTAEKVQIEKNW